MLELTIDLKRSFAPPHIAPTLYRLQVTAKIKETHQEMRDTKYVVNEVLSALIGFIVLGQPNPLEQRLRTDDLHPVVGEDDGRGLLWGDNAPIHRSQAVTEWLDEHKQLYKSSDQISTQMNTWGRFFSGT